jgi:hypothetical protein
MLEPDLWIGLLAAIVIFFLAGVWLGKRGAAKNQASEAMSEIDTFWNDLPWMPRPISASREASFRAALKDVSTALNDWHRRLRWIQPVEPLIAFVTGEDHDAPPAIVQGSLLAARSRVAKAHGASGEAVRGYVRASVIDAYLALWVELVASNGFDGILANRDRLAGINEPGFDALLGAELALTTYVGDEANSALAGALADAAAIVRGNLLKVGVVVDRPRLLCPAELASAGFRAIFEPGDSTRTVWIEAARAVVETGAFKEVIGAGVVVAVAQFGVKRDGRLIRPTRLCGYNPPEWQVS